MVKSVWYSRQVTVIQQPGFIYDYKYFLQKCPFDAISIVNLPTDLDHNTSHRYGANSFKLHRLPLPRHGQVLGLIGANGTGKSSALKILSGKIKPNLGQFQVHLFSFL